MKETTRPTYNTATATRTDGHVVRQIRGQNVWRHFLITKGLLLVGVHGSRGVDQSSRIRPPASRQKRRLSTHGMQTQRSAEVSWKFSKVSLFFACCCCRRRRRHGRAGARRWCGPRPVPHRRDKPGRPPGATPRRMGRVPSCRCCHHSQKALRLVLLSILLLLLAAGLFAPTSILGLSSRRPWCLDSTRGTCTWSTTE